MSIVHTWLIPALWLAYLAYWWVASRSVKATEQSEPPASRSTRAVLILAAVALLVPPTLPLPLLGARWLPLAQWTFWAGAAITAAGLLFSVWARRHLGSNWSQAVTLKEGHELVTGGPYAIVRHPIYTGLLLGFLGCAVARGEWRGLLAVALVLVPLWRKLRLEEQWLRTQFGEAYEVYCRRVAALVPGIF